MSKAVEGAMGLLFFMFIALVLAFFGGFAWMVFCDGRQTSAVLRNDCAAAIAWAESGGHLTYETDHICVRKDGL
jgi:hypothetical protein